MNLNFIPWIIVFVIVLAIAAYFVRRAGTETAQGPKLGLKESIGWGIIALGVLELLMPWAAGMIVAANPKNNPYSILTGAFLTLGSFVIIAGLALLLAKEH